MEDLALIVSLMLFVPIVVGILAVVLSALQRNRPNLRMFAILVTAVVGLTAALGLIQYPALGIVPLGLTIASCALLFIRSRRTWTIIAYVFLAFLLLVIALVIIRQFFPTAVVVLIP
jgi:hypothetical protein